jgi:predicted membrane channel-forming protein YqfA (hemolysin III family)
LEGIVVLLAASLIPCRTTPLASFAPECAIRTGLSIASSPVIFDVFFKVSIKPGDLTVFLRLCSSLLL